MQFRFFVLGAVILSNLLFGTSTAYQTDTPTPTATAPSRVVVQVIANTLSFYSAPTLSSTIVSKVKKNGKIVISGISKDSKWLTFPFNKLPVWIENDEQVVQVVEGDISALPITEFVPTPTPLPTATELPVEWERSTLDQFQVAKLKATLVLDETATTEKPLLVIACSGAFMTMSLATYARVANFGGRAASFFRFSNDPSTNLKKGKDDITITAPILDYGDAGDTLNMTLADYKPLFAEFGKYHFLAIGVNVKGNGSTAFIFNISGFTKVVTPMLKQCAKDAP